MIALRRPLLRSALLVLAPLAGCTSSGGPAPATAPPRPAPPLAAENLEHEEDVVVPKTPSDEPETETAAAGVAEEEANGGAPGEEPGSAAEEVPLPLGWVAGAPLTAEELLLSWYELADRELWLVVERLVATRLAFAEAQRLSIRLRPEDLETRVAAENEELAVQAEEAGLEVAEYVQRELGVAPAIYQERLRRASIRQMVAERSVRSWTLKSENASVRLIVLPEGDPRVAALPAELAAGADFAELAQRHSIDDSAQAGGLVPFLVRQEHSALARLVFATPQGEVGGPLTAQDHVFLVRVEELRAPLEGDWRTIAGAVEESLRAYPVTDGEFLHWKVEMEDRYPIDLDRLKRLLGMVPAGPDRP